MTFNQAMNRVLWKSLIVMTISIVYLVKGLLDENTRPEFIDEIKEVVDQGLKLGSQSTGVILHELDPDSICA